MKDMAKILKEVGRMQAEMQKVQEQLPGLTAEASAGGGAVRAKVNGVHELVSLAIDPEVLAAGDAELLQDMVLAAVNEAMRKVSELAQAQMAQVTGGVKLPGLP